MLINKINREEYHEQHFLIDKKLHNEFKEVISEYNNFGNSYYKNKTFDKTTISELIRMMIYNMVQDFKNSTDPNIELMKMLSDFRDVKAGAKQQGVAFL